MANGRYTNGYNNGYGGIQMVIAAGAILISLGSFLWSIANPRDDIKEAKQELQSEINSKESTDSQKEFATRVDEDIKDIKKTILALDAKIVPKDQHNIEVSENRDAREKISLRIDNLEKEFHGAWGAKEEFDKLNKAVDDIRDRWLPSSTTTTTTPGVK